jgi:competence protein ComEA
MKLRLFSIVLSSAALLLNVNLSLAADTPAAAPQAAASNAKVSTKTTKSTVAAKPKAAAKVKLVDINSASSAELKKLPDITEADAAKIIAGRPYGSKAWLVSKKVLTEEKYAVIRQLIIAKQSYSDGAKNAALYKKKG